MPNNALEDAIKEAYALAPSDVVYLDTLEIAHPAISPSIYIVKDRVSHDLTLETSVVKTFRACGFRMSRPAVNQDGVPELQLAIDNVGREISDFLKVAKASPPSQKTTVTFRPYIAALPTAPQMIPPLVLWLTDVRIGDVEATGRATFADITNKRFPTEFYTRARFPSLAN